MRIVAPKGLSGSEMIALEISETIKEHYPEHVNPDLLSALAGLRPPSNNMGATPPFTPYIFPHGEKSGENDGNKTKLDWLGFSSLAPLEAIEIALQIIWPEMSFGIGTAGMKGYPKTRACYVGTVQYGLIGYGNAAHNRSSISLPGTACETLITDEQFDLVVQVLTVLDARLSRVDLCLDFFQGEVTYDYALFAYERGDFKKPNAPKSPVIDERGKRDGDGVNLGRTMYLGPRDGELYGRIYEKGLEVFAKMPEEYREQCTEREQALIAEGAAVPTVADTWLRLEAEFKRKHADRPIPFEMLIERDEYFAGAYPFFASMLGKATGKGRGKLKSDSQMTHDRLIQAHRRSYGNHIHTLRDIGFTDREIVDLLDTGMVNQKLLKAGLVSVEKEAYQAALVGAELQGGIDADVPF